MFGAGKWQRETQMTPDAEGRSKYVDSNARGRIKGAYQRGASKGRIKGAYQRGVSKGRIVDLILLRLVVEGWRRPRYEPLQLGHVGKSTEPPVIRHPPSFRITLFSLCPLEQSGLP